MKSINIGMFARGAVVSTLALVTVACAAPSGSAEELPAQAGNENAPAEQTSNDGDVATEAVSDDTVFTETIVRTKDDGSVEIESRPITVAQERAAIEARKAQEAGIAVQQTRSWDTLCYGTSEWLYDGAIGASNKICFDHPVCGPSPVALTTIPRGTITCGTSVYTTYWAGGPVGCLGSLPLTASVDGNRIRSIWTGNGSPHGIWLFKQDGTQTGAFPDQNQQYTNINLQGSTVRTYGGSMVC